MPYTLQVGDILRVTTACAMTNQVGFNNFTYRVSTIVGASATDQDVANTLDGVVSGLYKLVLGNNASYYGLKVQKFHPTPVTLPAVSATNTGIGLMASECLPGQVAGVYTGRTALAGPRYRCRFYAPFPGRTANDVTTNVPNATYKTALKDVADYMYAPRTVSSGLNSALLVPVIWHRATATTTDIIARQASGKWATQKRRGNWGKPNLYPPF
jgi:hypothetical protein